MDLKNLMDQLLQAGKEVAQQNQSAATEKLHAFGDKAEKNPMAAYAVGAAGAGLLALLLGSKSGREVAGAGLKLGSLAAVGGLAYQLYQNWQGQNNAQTGTAQVESVKLESIQEKETDLSTENLLRAMVAAAKADGHVDQDELAHIRSKMQVLNLGSDVSELLLGELVRDTSVADIAAMANGNQKAALELYLVTRMVVDDQNAVEKAYLADLQKALALPDEVVAAVAV